MLSFLTFPEPAVYLDTDCIVTTGAELFNQIFAVPVPAIGYINTSPDGARPDAMVLSRAVNVPAL